MKTLLTTFALVLLLAGCSTFNNAVGVADTVMSVPDARSELKVYLNVAEQDEIRDELRLIDSTYQPIASVVYGQADPNISLEDALTTALRTSARRQDLEVAYKEIRRVVILHHTTTGEPIPATLARVSGEIETLYESWERVALANQKAQMYLRIAGQLAVAL